MELSVVIPVYNEAGNIGKLTRIVRDEIGEENELIVVDDGSTDGTADELDPNICSIIRFEANKGKGEAMKAGIQAARGDNILFMGGDGQDHPEEIPKFLAAINEGYDYVIGSRFVGDFQDGAITPVNFIGNRFLTFLFNVLFKTKVTDTQAEYKCIRADKLKEMKIESSRYEVETEMIIRGIRAGLKFTEVPVKRYARGAGISNLYQIPFGRIRFGLRIVGVMLKGFFTWK